MGFESVGEAEVVGDSEAEGRVEEVRVLEGGVVEELEIDRHDFAILFAGSFLEAGEEGGFARLACALDVEGDALGFEDGFSDAVAVTPNVEFGIGMETAGGNLKRCNRGGRNLY